MPDASVYYVFIAGLASFLSPCVLPLAPGYISIVSGFSLDQLKSEEQQKSVVGTVVMNSVMFIIGFSITFISLGAGATAVGQVLAARKILFGEIAGILLII